MADEPLTEEAYEEPYAEPYGEYEEPVTAPEDIGWQRLTPDAEFPGWVSALAIIAFVALAAARIDALIAGLDLNDARMTFQAIAWESGLILAGFTMLLAGLFVRTLSGGAKAALVIVGFLTMGLVQDLF